MTDKSQVFIVTNQGIRFYPFDPKLEQIDLLDIAWSLAGIRRWGAHGDERLTVGQHSVDVANYVRDKGFDKQTQLAALMHDASEAYVQDVAAPIKEMMPEYQAVEDRIQEVIAQKFNLIYPFPAIIHEADIACRHHEAYHLFGPKHPLSKPCTGPCGFRATPDHETYEAFMTKFLELTI